MRDLQEKAQGNLADPHLETAAMSGPPFDDRLGDGATKMIFDLAHGIPKASEKHGLMLDNIIGVEVHPRLALGNIGMPFLVHGPKVFAVHRRVDGR